MKLSNQDARAVDLVLDGTSTLAPEAGKSKGEAVGEATGSFFTHSSSGVGPASFAVPDGPSGTVNGMGATNNDNLAGRVGQVDAMLRLLDFLPAEEPPADLVQRTLRRVEELRGTQRASRHASLGSGGTYPGTGIASSQIRHSPDAGREDDPTAG